MHNNPPWLRFPGRSAAETRRRQEGKGKKRHLLVDMQGLVLKTEVEPTGATDCDGIKTLLQRAEVDFSCHTRRCRPAHGLCTARRPQSNLPRSTTANRARTKITVAKTPRTVNIIRLVTPNFSATRPTKPSVRPSSRPGRGKKLMPYPLDGLCQKDQRFCLPPANWRLRVGN